MSRVQMIELTVEIVSGTMNLSMALPYVCIEQPANKTYKKSNMRKKQGRKEKVHINLETSVLGP